MNTLFGESEIEKLKKLDYKTESHTFSKGVIAAYYNGLEYPMEIKENYIRIKRRKGNVFFNLFPTQETKIDNEKDVLYNLEKTIQTKIKTKEVVYDLDKIFTNPSKQVRRGISLTFRKEIVLRDCTRPEYEQLYQEWSEHKMNDPKVFRIAFTPKRYLRSFQLREKGFNIKEGIYYVNNKPYGAICYEVQGDIAFELAFISRYWRKDLKLINDLNFCILVNSFYELWRRGVKHINCGPDAGIRGLKVFKSKLPSQELIIYSN